MAFSLPFYEDVKQWSVEQLAAWLRQRNLPDIADIYLNVGIDGYAINTITECEHISILKSIPLRRRIDFLNLLTEVKSRHKNSNKLIKNGPVMGYKSVTCKSVSEERETTPTSRLCSQNIEAQVSDEVDEGDLSMLYIDETSNEDYLVPLSTGQSHPILPKNTIGVIPKKERCPSPFYHSEETNTKGNSPQKEDGNTYEIIQEDPVSFKYEKKNVNQDRSKPPDLPNRNFVNENHNSAPSVPQRIHSSIQFKRREITAPRSSCLHTSTSHRPQSSPPAPPSVRYRKEPSEINNATDSGQSKLEVLHLSGSKNIPMNSLYRSLKEKEFFLPVARNALSKILTIDGMFLIRPSAHSQQLLTLSVMSHCKIFNIVIRLRSDSKFALGSEKKGEMAFSAVEDIIKLHMREPIKVEDGSLVLLKKPPLKNILNCLSNHSS